MSEEKREDTSSVRVGDLGDCVVSQIMPYGAFVNLTESGKRGMIHISELSFRRLRTSSPCSRTSRQKSSRSTTRDASTSP